MQWQRALAVVFVGGLIFTGCEDFPIVEQPVTNLSLGFVTGLGGVTQPCECNSSKLGGLDRLVGLVDKRNRQNEFGLIFVGDTFYQLDDPPGDKVEKEHEKALAIASVLGELGPVAVLPGERDVEVGAERLQQFLESFRLPIFSGLRGPSKKRFTADSALRTIGGHKIGFIGIAGAQAIGQADAYTQGALALRRQGAQLVIALVGLGGSEGEALAAQIDGADIIVIGGRTESKPPQVIEGSLVVEAGMGGERLGSLTFHMTGQGPFRYYDEGRAQKATLVKSIRLVEVVLESMEPGIARDSSITKLEALKAQLAAFKSEPPQGRHVMWSLEEVGDKSRPLPWATKILTEHPATCACAASK
jgi:2',3'-cyclic-nucleotide 2'-phosphodiesterase (5'-nucleotidase family)